MRDASVHDGRVETIRRNEEVPVRLNPEAYYHRTQGLFFNQSMFGAAYTYAETHSVELDGKEREVVELSDEYFNLLKREVDKLQPKPTTS